MIKKIMAALALAVIPVFAVTAPASALLEGSKEAACNGVTLSGADCDNTSGEKVGSTVETVINLLSIVVGIAAVIMIIVNGLRFVTSNGDSNAVGSAKNGIIYALVGLVVVAFAQIIVKFVLEKTA